MAIALLDTPWKSFAVLLLYVLIQQVESNLLTPYVMAQQVSLLPAVTLLAQVFFATFFGFLGLLLALPLTVVGQVWLKEVIIKDLLDQWHSAPKNETEIVIVSDSLDVSESSEEEGERRTPADVVVQDKASDDELEQKM
jgi:predicted PurR-regulated permease PerM